MNFKKSIMLIPFVVIFVLTQTVNAFGDSNENEEEYSTIFEYGEWHYYDKGDYICVCGYTGDDRSITVPREINGKKVTSLSPEKMQTVTEEEKPEYRFLKFSNNLTKEIVVPEGVTYIDDYTFQNSKIEKAVLPKSLKNIGYKAFADCKNLNSIEIPENVKNIGKSAFASSGLEKITLYEGLESIGESAFRETKLMTDIRIPDSVSYIGERTFEGSGLVRAVLPSSLTVVKSALFSGCTNLKFVYFPEGVRVLENDIFYNCINLIEAYFPSTLREIDGVFRYFDSLENVYFAMSKEEIKTLWGDDAMGILTGQSIYTDPEDYSNVKLIADTPVPDMQTAAPAPPSKAEYQGYMLFLRLVITLCLAGTACFIFFSVQNGRKMKANPKKTTTQTVCGDYPKILGTWKCKKCGTISGPIANYCYKCGKERGKDEK